MRDEIRNIHQQVVNAHDEAFALMEHAQDNGEAIHYADLHAVCVVLTSAMGVLESMLITLDEQAEEDDPWYDEEEPIRWDDEDEEEEDFSSLDDLFIDDEDLEF